MTGKYTSLLLGSFKPLRLDGDETGATLTLQSSSFPARQPNPDSPPFLPLSKSCNVTNEPPPTLAVEKLKSQSHSVLNFIFVKLKNNAC